jgi:uncharacterized surface anchored protein
MKILILLLAFSSFLFQKKPATNARVILEDARLRKEIGTQETGENGKAGFQYLDEGSYRLLIEFPQQEGKWIKEKKKHITLAKASFNEKNRTYYYQGIEGYFAVKFESTRRVDSDEFRPVFREVRGGDERQIVIAEFQARKDGARVELTVTAITAGKFKKATQKIENDISTISIQGIK